MVAIVHLVLSTVPEHLDVMAIYIKALVEGHIVQIQEFQHHTCNIFQLIIATISAVLILGPVV